MYLLQEPTGVRLSRKDTLHSERSLEPLIVCGIFTLGPTDMLRKQSVDPGCGTPATMVSSKRL